MRDIVPNTIERRGSVRTPWSTYTDVTPKVSTRRRAVSTTPRVRTKATPRSPSVSTPSSGEYPTHESHQLPRRKVDSRRRPQKSPIDILEEFIRDFEYEDKEAVRATYNGSDWPRSSKILSSQKRIFVPPQELVQQPTMAAPQAMAYYPQSMTSLDLSLGYPTHQFVAPPQNRFLQYLNSQHAFSTSMGHHMTTTTTSPTPFSQYRGS